MSYAVDGTKIWLTRGDTFRAKVGIFECDCECSEESEEPYVPQPGDKIRFAAKRKWTSSDIVIEKDIPIETQILELQPEDTKELSFRPYVYDIQLTYANGDVDTFIKGILYITPETD